MLDKTHSKRAAASSHLVGSALSRREDVLLVAGNGSYVADIELTDPLHLSFVRATQRCCTIHRIDCESALAMRGVKAVFTGSDCDGINRLDVNPVLGPTDNASFELLARNTLRFVGQPVAAVAATSPAIAEDACESVWVETEDETEALSTTHKNVAKEQEKPDFERHWQHGDCDQVFKTADTIISIEIPHARLAPSPMETRGIAVEYHADRDAVSIWISTQTPHRARAMLADILRIDKSRMRIISPDVGGAFGMKASLYPEEIFTVWAAFKLKRSMRWIANRSEDLLSASHGRGLTSQGQLALDRDGKFLALKADVTASLGAWLTTSAAIPAWNAARILPGPYRIETIDLSARAYLSNTAPVSIYRGAGRPEAAMLMECLIEEAARQTGIHSTELRQINLLSPDEFSADRATGVKLDSGDYTTALKTVLASSGYEHAKETRDKKRGEGKLAGIGIGFFVEPSGQGWETATVKLHPDGRVEVYSGSSSQGHGRETAYAQIVADALDTSIDEISITFGDTETCPNGIGAVASRSTGIGGSAVHAAALEVRSKLYDQGFSNEVIEANIKYHVDGEAWGYGCYLAEVEIDRETGKLTVENMHCLDDAGRIINPEMLAGQIYGGVAQGLGEALMEALHYDDTGQLLTGSLMDYALPRASDMPDLTLQHFETPSPNNLLGAKGVGEAGTIGAPVSIFNAAMDALSPLGKASLSMPLTSTKLWHEIEHLTQERN